MIGLHPADSFEAYLVSGGLPLICSEWGYSMSLWDYLEEAVVDPTSALLVSAERSLAAEFPSEAQAKTVLQAIGSGERTFANIARASGNLQPTSLKRSLDLLIAKHVVEAEIPLSTATSRNKKYRVADPYLSFWLTFLGPYIGEIERGRGDRVVASFAWWRGFCSAPWRSCCRDHAGLAAGRCRGLNREGCARSGPFGSLPLRQSPKAPPLTRITMPRPMRTMGKRMCSQRSSTSAIGGRVATNFARATRTATSARKTMQ